LPQALLNPIERTVTDPSPDTPESAASAARRGTDDPGVFLIPEDQLPRGFADKVAEGGFVPAPPRPASTVVLARDGEEGPEVLLLRRHGRSGFAAGAWVFPGGTVDKADRDLAIADRIDGPTPEEWALRLQLSDPAEALGFVVAAIREAFEETGILLARAGGESEIADADSLEVARRALLSEVVDLRQVAVTRNVHLSAREMVYLAHWVTPEPEPRRYDTRFFLARAAADAVCVPHEAEMTESIWLSPAVAVQHFEADSLKMLPPTVHTLRRLARFTSTDDMLAALADAPVPMILPVMRRAREGVAIVLPPDPDE
jgi:8-oxo-dGTP pyrophosphatase MutT (NUDIX family)